MESKKPTSLNLMALKLHGLVWWVQLCLVSALFFLLSVLIYVPWSFLRSIDFVLLQGIGGILLIFIPLWLWGRLVKKYRKPLISLVVSSEMELRVLCLVFVSVLFVLFGFFRLLPIFSYSVESLKIGMQFGSEYRSSVTPVREGVILIEGFISKATVERLEALIVDETQTYEIQFDSNGGLFKPSLYLAQFISERPVATSVVGKCDSACAIPFLGSKVRILYEGASVGFHQLTSLGGDAAQAKIASQIMEEYFLDTGVQKEFVQRVFELPERQLWRPNASELIASNFATHFKFKNSEKLTIRKKYCLDKDIQCSLKNAD
jgi:hypothetical protein